MRFDSNEPGNEPECYRVAFGADSVQTTSCGRLRPSRLAKVMVWLLRVVTTRLISWGSSISEATSTLLQESGPNGPDLATGVSAAGRLVEVMSRSTHPSLVTGCTA